MPSLFPPRANRFLEASNRATNFSARKKAKNFQEREPECRGREAGGARPSTLTDLGEKGGPKPPF